MYKRVIIAFLYNMFQYLFKSDQCLMSLATNKNQTLKTKLNKNKIKKNQTNLN